MLAERSNDRRQWAAGASLPEAKLPAISRTMLALYAGGSGDHNPLHIDIDFARNVARMDDVIGHGMLTMALIARYVTSLTSASSLRSYSLRFVGPSRVGDQIACSGRVARVFDEQGKQFAEVELQATRQGGDVLATGAAVFAIEEA